MAVAGTDLVLIERGGVPYKATAQDVANLIAGSPHAMEPGLSAGEYITAAITALPPSTTATAANRLELFPFRAGRNVTVDLLALEVTTGVASAQARVGIYSADATTGLPGALLTGQGTLLDCASAGVKTSAISPALVLEAGKLYWLAVHGSSTQTYRTLQVGALTPLPQVQAAASHSTQRRATLTFASGLPTTAPATTLTSAACPMLKLRVA
jgi:hypothetical protein